MRYFGTATFALAATLLLAVTASQARTQVSIEAWAVNGYDNIARGAAEQIDVPPGVQFHAEQAVVDAFTGHAVTRIHFVSGVADGNDGYLRNFEQSNSGYTIREMSAPTRTVGLQVRAFGQSFPEIQLDCSEPHLVAGIARSATGADNTIFVVIQGLPLD